MLMPLQPVSSRPLPPAIICPGGLCLPMINLGMLAFFVRAFSLSGISLTCRASNRSQILMPACSLTHSVTNFPVQQRRGEPNCCGIFETPVGI